MRTGRRGPSGELGIQHEWPPDRLPSGLRRPGRVCSSDRVAAGRRRPGSGSGAVCSAAGFETAFRRRRPRRQTEGGASRIAIGDRKPPNVTAPASGRTSSIATCAVIGGAESRDGIALFGRPNETFFRRFLKLANGIASPDTFERVFAKLDPAFAAAFGRVAGSGVRVRRADTHRHRRQVGPRGEASDRHRLPAPHQRVGRVACEAGFEWGVARRQRVRRVGPRAAGRTVCDRDRRPESVAGGLAVHGGGGAGEPRVCGRRPS